MYIIGYAGHGKDTVKNILKDHYSGNTFYNLSFADTMKSQVSDILPSHILNIVDGDSSLDKLNNLKDNHPEVEVFSGFNARQLLQILGTEFYRSDLLDPNIHVRFSAKKVLDSLESGRDDNVVYASSDTRFPNELNFLTQASQCSDDAELSNFLKYYLNTCKEIDAKDKILKHFKNIFNISNMKGLPDELFNRMWVDVDMIKDKPNYLKEVDFIIPDTAKMSKEEASKYGLVHIFRPIVSPEIKLGENLNATDLMAKIKSYTQMTIQEVKSIKNNFNHYNVDFNSSNVQKFGYLRADVKHYSESALNHRKPEAVLSEPMTNPINKDIFENNLKKMFDNSLGFKNNKTCSKTEKFQTNQKRKI
jgi:hypothetical protein